jgi:hypothetical protein
LPQRVPAAVRYFIHSFDPKSDFFGRTRSVRRPVFVADWHAVLGKPAANWARAVIRQQAKYRKAWIACDTRTGFFARCEDGDALAACCDVKHGERRLVRDEECKVAMSGVVVDTPGQP